MGSDVEAGGRDARPHAVVVGAGFGGMSAAARLACCGYNVTCVEKHATPGGRCTEIVREGHRFDVGPSIILVPSAYFEAFASIGDDLNNHVELMRVDPTYTIRFYDGTKLELTGDLQRMETQLESMETGSFKSFLGLLHQGHDNLHMTLENIAHRNFYSLFEFFSPLNAFLLHKLKVLRKHYNYISQVFKDSRLRSAFSFQDMYIGVSPYDAPATFSLLQYTEFCDGVWYCRGGLYKISQALAKAAEGAGVKFLYSTEVSRIEVEGNRVTGVRTKDGGLLEADVVVANADLPYVYQNLLPDKKMGEKFSHLKYTSSAIMFYWGMDKQFTELSVHNMFLAKNFRSSFDDIFKRFTLPEEPSFYIHVPSRIDPTAAPPNQDTFMVLVPCGHIEEAKDQQWDELIARARAAVLRKLKEEVKLESIEEHIKFEEIISPAIWKDKFNLAKGSCFGLSHTFTQLGYLRPQNQHDTLRNLFFTGCSTHPGSGLPNVLVSARLCVERILMQEAGYPTTDPFSSSTSLLLLLLWTVLLLLLLRAQYPLTYGGFHFLFTLPPALAMVMNLLKRSRSSSNKPHVEFLHEKLKKMRMRSLTATCLLCFLSLTYTTPWDNYLVYKGIWTYPPGRVLFTIGYVPVEEYCFFIIQTIASSLWLLTAMERQMLQLSIRNSMLRAPQQNNRGSSAARDRAIRVAGGLLLAALSGLSWVVFFSGSDKAKYLSLITGWALPVVCLQWIFGGHIVWRERRLVLVSVCLPTAFLWMADGIAIYLNIWSLSSNFLLGPQLGSLPLEEALFFLVTNVMVVQGGLLFVRTAERMEHLGLDGRKKEWSDKGLLRRIFQAAANL